MFSPALSFDVIITAISCLCSQPEQDQNFITPRSRFWKQPDHLKNIDESIYRLEEEAELLEQYISAFIEQQNSATCRDYSIPVEDEKIIQYKNPGLKPFEAICKNIPLYGNWLLIQRRFDGSENFYRNWLDYKEGFGQIKSEFFIGLKRLHTLTYLKRHELLIRMKKKWDKKFRFAHYDDFRIGSEAEGFPIQKLGDFNGFAGDSLRQHLDAKFTTFDRDNDISPSENCAVTYHGGWWFQKCLTSHLNGEYFSDGKSTKPGNGISWYLVTEFEDSLVNVDMLIRPVK